MEDEIITEILNLNNQDDSKRTEATESLSNRIQSPEFIEYLLQLISDTNIQSHHDLYVQVLIVFKVCLKYHYSNCDITDDNFIKELPIALIQLLTTMPPEFHSHIIDCFRQINIIALKATKRDPQLDFLHSIQISTLPSIIEQLKAKENFISNLYILKLFIKFYIKENELDIETHNSELIAEMLTEIFPIFLEILNTDEINEFTASSARIISQILYHCINNDIIIINEFIEEQDLITTITNYSNFFASTFENSNSLNRHLLKLSYLFIVIYDSSQEFHSTIYPLLFNLATTILTEMDSTDWDIFIRLFSLKIIYYIYDSNEFIEDIESPEFITSILIPSTKLNDQELEELSTIPDLISNCFLAKKNDDENTNFDDEKSAYAVRFFCGKFAKRLLINPDLHSIVAQQSEDPIEFECQVFLLSCVDSISTVTPKDEIQFILDSAISNFDSNESFVQASLIYYLYHHISLISDCSTLIELCVFDINNSNDPLIIVAAVDLLRQDRLNFNRFQEIEEKENIIPKLLAFCEEFNYWNPLDVIVKLVISELIDFDESDKIEDEFLNDVLTALFETCLNIVSRSLPENENENENENEFGFDVDSFDFNNSQDLDQVFGYLINIIENANITDELVSFCLDQCLSILKESKSIFDLVSLFNFVSFFNYKLDVPIENQFEFISIALSQNDEIAPSILDISYPLILNPNSNINEREDFVSALAEICQFYTIKIKEVNVHVNLASLLRVCGALIEVFGNDYINLAEFAFFFFQSGALDYDINQGYFTHLLYLLYNALNANPEFVFNNIDEKLINYLLCLSIPDIAHNQKSPEGYYGCFYKGEVKCHFCILLEIARKGREKDVENEILAIKAEDCFAKALVLCKCFPNATNTVDYFGNRKFNQFFAIRYYPSSIDQIDPYAFLQEVSDQAGFQLDDYNLRNLNIPNLNNQETQEGEEEGILEEIKIMELTF